MSSNVSAWPLFTHKSSGSTFSETKILLGLISHRRQDHETSFVIHPFLFKYSYNSRQDDFHFKLMFFFYLFYLHFNNTTRTWLCLPLLSFMRHNRSGSRPSMWGAMGAGLLGVAFSCAGKIFVFSPPFLTFSYQTGKDERAVDLTTCLLLYWRVKVGKVDARLFWPFYGKIAWIDAQKGFVEHSVLWPFFRYRFLNKKERATLHLFWPFFKTVRCPNKFNLRFLPFTWIKRSEGKNRGFILLYYWDQNDEKSTWGIFPVFHMKRDQAGVIKTVYALLGMYRTSKESITMMVTPLWWSHWTLSPDGAVTSFMHLLVPFFAYANYSPGGTSYFDNFMVCVPLLATLVSFRPKDTITNIFVLGLVWYYKNEKEKKNYIYGTIYGKYQNGDAQYHSVLAVLALWKQSLTDIDVWVLGPIIRYRYDGVKKETKTWFIPFYYVRHDERRALEEGDYGCTQYRIRIFYFLKIDALTDFDNVEETKQTDGYHVTAYTPDQGTGALHMNEPLKPQYVQQQFVQQPYVQQYPQQQQQQFVQQSYAQQPHQPYV